MNDVAHLRETGRMYVTPPRVEACAVLGREPELQSKRPGLTLESQSRSLAGEGLGGLEAQQGTGLPSNIRVLTVSCG